MRKCIKDQWARDDPAFVVLLGFFISVATVAYCVMFYESLHSIFLLALLKAILYSVFVDFIFIGIIIATVYWFIANKFMLFQNPHGWSMNSS